jgi:hypothetical protein
LIPTDPFLDPRTLFERQQAEAAERRMQALAEQRAPERTPEARVRTWESLHQVRLPRSPHHAVLTVVAEQTGLALTELYEVQRQRAGT